MALKTEIEEPARHEIKCIVCNAVTHTCERDIDCDIYLDTRVETGRADHFEESFDGTKKRFPARDYRLCDTSDCRLTYKIQLLTDELERTKQDRDEYLKTLSLARLTFLKPDQLDKTVEDGKIDLTRASMPATQERIIELSKCKPATLEIYVSFFHARMLDHANALRLNTAHTAHKQSLSAKKIQENKDFLNAEKEAKDKAIAKRAKVTAKSDSDYAKSIDAEFFKTPLGKFVKGYEKLGMSRAKALEIAKQAGFDIDAIAASANASVPGAGEKSNV